MKEQDELESEMNESQRFIQISKTWNWKNKPSGYMIEFQYVLKTRKQALELSDVIENWLKEKGVVNDG